LRYCGQHGLQAAPRGTGTSTGGLSQIDSGIIVDLSS
ncbi:MAG: FAD-binding protein, partial [Corynebacteriales bacterium]|nr:FAD-binding protein [Mycobacteriales bacterium]